MSIHRTRREALQLALAAGLAGSAGLLAPVGASASSRAGKGPSAASLKLEPLGDRLSLVTGAACNVVVLRGDDGLLLVDGGAAADSRALLALLDGQFPRLPVRQLLNTHWHLAHTGLNAAARRQGAEVLAHENTRLWMSTVVNSRWEDRLYPAQPEPARPTRTFYDGVQTLEFAGEKIDYALLPQAHTDGDLYVRFRNADVVVAGDVFAPGHYPIVDSATNGWLGGMHAGLKTLAGLGTERTRFVPGTGPVGGLAELKAQQELCYTVLTRIGESYYKGETWEQLLAQAPTREFDARYGNPDLFLRQSYESAWYHVNEIRRVAR
jgi:glyoxylase-like metal-dependent hydrolase (beta-lactamase superfamily II)